MDLKVGAAGKGAAERVDVGRQGPLLLLSSDPRQDAGFHGRCIVLPVGELAALALSPAVPHTPLSQLAVCPRVGWSVRGTNGGEEADGGQKGN